MSVSTHPSVTNPHQSCPSVMAVRRQTWDVPILKYTQMYIHAQHYTSGLEYDVHMKPSSSLRIYRYRASESDGATYYSYTKSFGIFAGSIGTALFDAKLFPTALMSKTCMEPELSVVRYLRLKFNA